MSSNPVSLVSVNAIEFDTEKIEACYEVGVEMVKTGECSNVLLLELDSSDISIMVVEQREAVRKEILDNIDTKEQPVGHDFVDDPYLRDEIESFFDPRKNRFAKKAVTCYLPNMFPHRNILTYISSSHVVDRLKTKTSQQIQQFLRELARFNNCDLVLLKFSLKDPSFKIKEMADTHLFIIKDSDTRITPSDTNVGTAKRFINVTLDTSLGDLIECITGIIEFVSNIPIFSDAISLDGIRCKYDSSSGFIDEASMSLLAGKLLPRLSGYLYHSDSDVAGGTRASRLGISFTQTDPTDRNGNRIIYIEGKEHIILKKITRDN